MAPTRSVRAAAIAWSTSVVWSPRRFADLITAVEVRDEVFERLFTETVRRDVREERMALRKGRTSSRRLDPSAVDPFSISIPDLRSESEYVTTCDVCAGSGAGRCSVCAGGGRARCGHCGGSGKELKRYAKSSRWVKCTVCRASGTVVCGGCGGAGTVPCTGCIGSGHQLAWLTYDQTSRAVTLIEPNSPVLVAHKELTQRRMLEASELGAFGVQMSVDNEGPLSKATMGGIEPACLRKQLASLDPRLERVSRQQYLKLAVVRRDATFEMCGARGVLVLSGTNLAGSSTKEALAPIRRRAILWVAFSVAFLFGVQFLRGLIEHPGAYFESSNGAIGVLLTIGSVLSVLLLGGALRAVRPGFRFGPLWPSEKFLAGGAASVALLVGILVLRARPSVGEAQRALAAGDIDRADIVAQALSSTLGQTRDVQELGDSVLLAKAKTATGDAKLHDLDKVASNHGTRAAAASAKARAERLSEVAALAAQSKPDVALSAFDTWFSGEWQDDQRLAEVRAQLEDSAYALCADDFCRIRAARGAQLVPTAARTARVSEVRNRLLANLAYDAKPGETSRAHVQRLRTLGQVAKKTRAVAGDDSELAGKADTAVTICDSERAKVPLLGADESVVDDVLGVGADQGANTMLVSLAGGVSVYRVHDALRRCMGIYVVGASKGARAINGTEWSAARILAQAVGHSSTIRKPVGSATVSRWAEGPFPVVARWEGSNLIELRVGDATP